MDQVRYKCDCGGLIEIIHSPQTWQKIKRAKFDERKTSRRPEDISGVWRFREAILPGVNDWVCHPEGRTGFYKRKKLSDYAELENLYCKHEGENPTGSFKDRGMTVAITQAKALGMQTVACASTGNTSASLASYAAHAGLKAVVFLPDGKVASGKLAQALGYGATCLAIKGDFDAAMNLVQKAASEVGVYMVNSLNPFRPEGQKTIIWEALQDLNWQAPDWFVFPGGNLGNTSAFGKALREAHAAGWIDRLPRLATVQAAGANPFYNSFRNKFQSLEPVTAETIATAIRIGNPVNFSKARHAITSTNGLVIQVDDAEIIEAKKQIDMSGIGCEPASACSLAGVKQLRSSGEIKESDTVVAILTGHMLKDPDCIMQNYGEENLHVVDATLEAVAKYL
jgi:threonine synthase